LPKELWTPSSYKERAYFFRTIGFTDEELAEKVLDPLNFCVWSHYILKPSRKTNEDLYDIESSPEMVQKSMQ